MAVFIIGGGRTGSFLAKEFLTEEGKEVVIVEKEKEVVEKLKNQGFEVYWANACDPIQLEDTGIRRAEVAVVVTGHDEDNLVICQLLKKYFGVPRVIARVNHPKNKWLYTRDWGVELAVSATHIIADILREEAHLGDLVTLLRLRGGEVAIVELAVESGSPLIGKAIRELTLPSESLLVGIVRGKSVLIPQGDTVLEEGDEIIALSSVKMEGELARALGATT